MRVQDARRTPVRRPLPAVALVAAILVTACGSASVAPSAPPASTAGATAAAASLTSWAAWIDHQGFGGQAGPNEVRRTARYIADHSGEETLFSLDKDIELVARILAWLDAHPATACWADYHAQVRASLVIVHDAWISARPVVEAGHLVPADVIGTASEAANAADGLPEPTGCP